MSFNRASFRDSETDYIGELTDMNQPDNPIFETDNLTMLTDFYELTMANGFFQTGNVDKIAYFDMFFRRIPDNGGLAIMAGVEQLVQYLKNLRFTDGDIAYLRSKKLFNEAFLEYLRTFRFACDVWAVPEGTPVFPHEPIVTVRGPIIQAQFIETMVLLAVNHQSLIATKANRIVRAAKGRAVMEFGSRRAQGYDGAMYGARAAYIGGASARHAPLWIESSAYRLWAPWLTAGFNSSTASWRPSGVRQEYPDSCTLLVDTYSTLKSGVPNAIQVFNEVIVPAGFRPKAIRIDSGDITYLSKKARKMLDDAGFPDCPDNRFQLSGRIHHSGHDSARGLCGFLWGGRASDHRRERSGVWRGVQTGRGGGKRAGDPRIKVSENVTKITNPCFKKLWRLYDRDSGKAIADVITLNDETIDDTKPYEIFDPEHIWKRKRVENYTAVPLQEQLFRAGECVYDLPTVQDLRSYCQAQIGTMWDEVLRFENPHKYYVDLSQPLWDEKQRLLSEYSR